MLKMVAVRHLLVANVEVPAVQEALHQPNRILRFPWCRNLFPWCFRRHSQKCMDVREALDAPRGSLTDETCTSPARRCADQACMLPSVHSSRRILEQ